MESKKKNFAPLPFLLAFSLSACIPTSPLQEAPVVEESTESSSEISLEGSHWVLHRLNDQEVVEEEQVSLSFAEGMVQGHDGCMDYSSPYAVDGSTFAVGQISTSGESDCSAPLMQQSQAYRMALSIAAAHSLDGQELQLQAADGRSLAVFTSPEGQVIPTKAMKKQEQEQEEVFTDLSDTKWRVQAYSDGHTLVDVLERFRIPTVEFRVDGNIGGSAGCNSYLGTYTYPEAGNSLRVSRLALTKMACEPPARMYQEELFIEALTRSVTYHQRGKQLELRDEDGLPTLLLLRDTP